MTRFGVRVYKEYFNFASSHFLVFPDGAREELHGHNYQVRVAVAGALGPGDVVLDFCQLKPIVRRLCAALDHRMLLPLHNDRIALEEDGDHLAVAFRRTDGGSDRFLFPRRDCVLLPIPNTSTERLAEHLGGQLVEALRQEAPGATLTRLEVEVEESRGQCGQYVVDLDDLERA
ncbi:MAG: 6-carboxytetrahydropterin synthase [Planctomycetes bacterium]|nr:6-carboxytetrahydropterin synthase [Planctomycetota bacterium]